MLPSAAVVVALGAGLIGAPPASADGTRGHGPASTSWPPVPGRSGPEAAAADAAKERARKSGSRVVVEHLTTATSQTFATPRGTFTTDTAPVPQRIQSPSGTWQAVDATLRPNTDGSLSPTAVPSGLRLSGGGSGPMATMTTTDGKKLALKAPFPLPKPSLNGDSALYASVLPGVDLELSATTLGGWRQVLIVRTPEAAADPAVKKLQLAVEADGLTVTADGAGNLTATDGQGRTRFSAPTPLMWDSAGAAAPPTAPPTKPADGTAPRSVLTQEAGTPSTTDGPGTGASVQPVATTVNADGIQLVPDQALLGQGKGPWYIDPGWNPTLDNPNQAWSQVQEAYPDTNEFNGTQNGQDRPAAGYCGYNIGNPPCTGIGRTRAYFQIGVDSRLHGAEVLGATFYADVVSSSSPSTVTPMGLYLTGYLGNPTSWNRQPCDTNSRMGGCAKVGHVNMSGSGDIQFDVKDVVKRAVAGTWPTITLGLAPDDEYNKYYRQRFTNTPHIVVEYDIRPTVWWPRTAPTPGFADTASYADCRTPGTANPWDNPGWVGANNNITLTTSTYSATGQQLWTVFQYWDDDNNGDSKYAETGWQSSHGAVTVDIGPLTDGHQYGWQSRTTDGTLTSFDADMCFFRVDRTPPTAAVTSTDFPASGTIGAHPKRAGQKGTFTLTGTDPAPAAGGRTSGLACARWTTDPVKAAATGWKCNDTGPGIVKLTGGKTDIDITPAHWGTNHVYLQTQDNAGNMSQPAVYSYYAPADPNSATPIFGDLTGDRKADVLLPDSAGALRVIGGGSDPAAAPKAGIGSAPGGSGWNGIQISHRGSLGDKNVDDLFAHKPDHPYLHLYLNDGVTGRFDGQAGDAVPKPPQCVTPDRARLDCAASGYGTDWSKVTQIAAFGATTGDTGVAPDRLPRTSLLFVESGRLWLSTPHTSGGFAAEAVLLSANDTRWGSFDLITPGRAQGTDFPTLWARSRTDGALRAFSVKGTAQAPDLSGFTDPTAGPVMGTVDPKAYARIGSEGDLTGDGVPDLWAVDGNQQLVGFSGAGTPPNGGSVPHPTVTGFAPAPVTLGNLNMPRAQWPLVDPKGSTIPSTVGNYPATGTGVTWPTATIDGRTTTYASFAGPSSAVTTAVPVVDTRKSFTLTTTAKVTKAGGVVLSQGPALDSSLLLYPDHHTNTWQFSLANPNASGWPYDTTTQTNSAASIAFGAWTRLTAVYDHDTGQMRLYVNGTLAATGRHDASLSPAPAGALTLGRFGVPGTTTGLEGGISNLAVYPYAASVTTPEAVGPVNLTVAATNCVDNDGNGSDDGNRIQITHCNGTDAQKFGIRDDGTVRTTSGKCLNAAAAGTANTTPIELRTCDGNAPSQRFLPRADGSIHHPASGRCLDLGNLDTTPGRQLWLFDCNRSDAQRWTVPVLGTAPLPVPAPVP
ncbi:ricin-type beta-trefoil lectin domain protein [Streptomyces sp. JL4002]|uniref:ricin-type beta-trefoil lectin domain protein n=1 Tax=Streptomyces sp. JL4002 TaxID=3404781 RepID=UPI003B27FA5B